jgi:uncharacterized protein involved in type VI secretion and phage assembly
MNNTQARLHAEIEIPKFKIKQALSSIEVTMCLDDLLKASLVCQRLDFDTSLGLIGETVLLHVHHPFHTDKKSTYWLEVRDSETEPQADRILTTLHCSSALGRLNFNCHNQIYQNITLRDLFKTLFKRNGILNSQYQIKLKSDPEHIKITQYQESDWAFFKRVCQENKLTFWHAKDSTRGVIEQIKISDCPYGESYQWEDMAETHKLGSLATEHCSWQISSTHNIQDSYSYFQLNSAIAPWIIGDSIKQNTDHPLMDKDEYLIQDISLKASGLDSYQKEQVTSSQQMQIGFVPKQAYIKRVHPKPAKPLIDNFQTAVVTGPKDKPVYTNEKGEVKLKHHWDFNPGADEHSSPWIPVTQISNDPQKQVLLIPRVGQEVIVGYENGDPNNPIVVGQVSNRENPLNKNCSFAPNFFII